jgi:hypothetical protein
MATDATAEIAVVVGTVRESAGVLWPVAFLGDPYIYQPVRQAGSQRDDCSPLDGGTDKNGLAMGS